MDAAKPLPAYLARRYEGWKLTSYPEKESLFRQLAEGQSPRAMIISCCDSRVHVTDLFGADQGEFFVHRNIANLVPPFAADGKQHGTSAAIEFAVTALKVAHLLVIGHSSCGGVKGCYDMCSGQAPELEQKTSFVGRWMDSLRPGFDRLPEGSDAERIAMLEKEAVLVSLENLMSFPFVKDATESGSLSLHGLWVDIGEGGLEVFEPGAGFKRVITD